jgi:NTE family protein
VTQIKKTKTISLVLGSGGARGLAHIGIIRWLEEHDFEIKSISGCSAGALIGGIYAMGKLDVFEQWVRGINKLDIVSLLDFSWKSNGLVKGAKIIDTLTQLVGNELIEDLPIKFTAVASDIHTEKEVWMNSGPLFDAIRASISLPLFFTPFRYKNTSLIDGGVLNPVPIAPTFGDDTELIIAVNLGGKVDENAVIKPSDEAEDLSQNPLSQKVTKFIDELKGSSTQHFSEQWDAYDIANQAFDAMQSAIARQKLAAYPPDYFIEIARNTCGTLAFNLAAPLIDLGYQKAQECLGHLIKEQQTLTPITETT